MAQLYQGTKLPMSWTKRLTSIPWMRKKADSQHVSHAIQETYFPASSLGMVSPQHPDARSSFLRTPTLHRFFTHWEILFLIFLPAAYIFAYILQNRAPKNFCHQQRNPYKYSRIHGPQFEEIWTMDCPHGRIVYNHLMGYGMAWSLI